MDAHARSSRRRRLIGAADLHRVGRRTLDVARSGADTGTHRGAHRRRGARNRPRHGYRQIAGRPLDHRRRRQADRPRVADQRGRRRRDGDVAERAARQRQDRGHDFDVRMGSGRCRPPVRSGRAARSRAAVRTAQGALSQGIDRGAGQRPDRRAVRQRLLEGRRRQDGEPGGQLRGEQRGARLAAPDRTGGPEQPGTPAGPLRRSEPQRDDRARPRDIHESYRHQQHHRTRHDPAVSGGRVRGALGHQGELGVRV